MFAASSYDVQESHFVEKHSVQFFTKTGKASMPFYFDKERPGDDSARTWQVRRSEFDQLLMDTAAGQGAEVHRGVNVRDVLFNDGRAVGVRAVAEGNGGPVDLPSRIVIDATGQSALLARRLDLGRVDYGLRHASIYTHFRGAIRDEGKDEGATLILHTTSGECWFWYIPLAGDVVSVGVVGPMDTLIRNRDGRPHEIFFEEVGNCAEIERRIRPARQCRPVSVMKDFSYRIEKMAGDGWIAVNVFYDRNFSVGAFLRLYPQHQSKVTRILIGDVFELDFTSMFEDMATFAAAGGGKAARAPEAAAAQPLQAP
ncbi:MAG: tryptophan 7-halogenase [Acidobacteriota bacterium]|nr:tryptophan 7-halogenase [Acidobacteriota bacterium]